MSGLLVVSDFIIIAPAGMGKAIEWAEPMLRSYLAGHFPLYNFRIEPYGPFAEEEKFSIIPIMNRMPPQSGKVSEDAMVMGYLNPSVIPEIQNALRLFDPVTSSVH